MGSAAKEIIIDLHESSNAREFDSANLIHQREFDRVKELIDYRINRASSSGNSIPNQNSRQRYNDTISILGSRGSGKTSFLLSLLKYYKVDSDKKNEVEVLDIIDPTLIEEKGHIFLTIISLIEESVSNKIQLSECSPNDSSYHLKKEYKDKLRKLADGLPSMDGVGSNLEHSDWQDAEFIMDRGLKSVKAATNLEANFNELLSCALKAINKKVIIITLDDIDVDFRKGWPVLETIRKYLTSPHIIVLLSGDLRLYSKAIRKQQWKNFGKALLINEGEKLHKISEYNNLVTEMESQYIQKVIKPENRIHLTTLFEKVNTYDSIINVLNNNYLDITKPQKEVEIRAFYNAILANFGIRNPYQADAYRSFLLSLPIRTQIHFLSGISDEDSDVTDAFRSDLFEKDIDIDFAKTLAKMLNVVILKLLIKEQILAETYQLQPTTDDVSLNSSLVALSFLFSQHVKKSPYLIFDYLIKIGYVRNVLNNIGYAEKNDKKVVSSFKPSIEGLCHHSGIFQDKVLRDVVGNMTSYIDSLPNRNEHESGIIYLRATAKKEKGSKEDSVGRIDYEFDAKKNEVTTLQQTLAFIPISTSEFLDRKSSRTTYSIYALLGMIGELIRKVDLNDMENGLLELSQWRTYPKVSFEKGLSNLSNEEDFNEITVKTDTEGYSKLIEWFKAWHSGYPGKIMYSPHLIGKISTRIYYSFNSINNNKKCNINLGVAMHRRLIALMNAILIEDVRENCTKTQGLNISNAVTSDTTFINNLKFASSVSGSDFSFSKWMLSCPLLLLYLDNKILNEKSFIKFIFSENEEKVISFSENTIYNKLLNVDVTEFELNINTKPIEGLKFSYDYNNLQIIADKLKEIGLTYNNFMKIKISEFNSKYSNNFTNKVNSNSLEHYKDRISEKGIKW